MRHAAHRRGIPAAVFYLPLDRRAFVRHNPKRTTALLFQRRPYGEGYRKKDHGSHPIVWNVPTQILYGAKDSLTAPETVRAFAGAHGAGLTVMEHGEHWFHTENQMRFLDDWIRKSQGESSMQAAEVPPKAGGARLGSERSKP